MARNNSAYHARMEKLFEGSRIRTYPKNQLIQYQGDSLTHVHLIKAGYVKVYTILDSGDMRTLLILGPGDIFPMDFSSNFDWENYEVMYFYQSLTDTQLKVLDSVQLKRKIQSDSKISGLYLEYMAATNRVIINQLEIMKSKKAINKILLLLPYLIGKLGRQIRPNV